MKIDWTPSPLFFAPFQSSRPMKFRFFPLLFPSSNVVDPLDFSLKALATFSNLNARCSTVTRAYSPAIFELFFPQPVLSLVLAMMFFPAPPEALIFLSQAKCDGFLLSFY